MKKIGYLVMMVLITHGTIVSMMHGRKLLRNHGNTIKLRRSVMSTCLPAWPEPQATKKIDSSEKIDLSSKNIEIKLEEQHNKPYILKLGRTEIKCKFASVLGFDPNETIPVFFE